MVHSKPSSRLYLLAGAVFFVGVVGTISSPAVISQPARDTLHAWLYDAAAQLPVSGAAGSEPRCLQPVVMHSYRPSAWEQEW